MEGKIIITNPILGKEDIDLLKRLDIKIQQKAMSKFLLKDITPQNLSYVAWEVNALAKQFIGGHLFFNHGDNKLYKLCYMKLKVSKTDGIINVSPCFELSTEEWK